MAFSKGGKTACPEVILAKFFFSSKFYFLSSLWIYKLSASMITENSSHCYTHTHLRIIICVYSWSCWIIPLNMYLLTLLYQISSLFESLYQKSKQIKQNFWYKITIESFVHRKFTVVILYKNLGITFSFICFFVIRYILSLKIWENVDT